MNKGTRQGFWYGFNLTAAVLIAFFLIGLPLLFASTQFIGSVDLSAVQLEPAVVQEETTFAITLANEGRTPLNAVEFELSYDPGAIQIQRIQPHSTLCEPHFVIANIVNNASGTALFQCGTVMPFTEATGTIATVHVLPLRSGTTSISFAELSHVMAHDGLGTDATRERHGLIFTAL